MAVVFARFWCLWLTEFDLWRRDANFSCSVSATTQHLQPTRKTTWSPYKSVLTPAHNRGAKPSTPQNPHAPKKPLSDPYIAPPTRCPVPVLVLLFLSYCGVGQQSFCYPHQNPRRRLRADPPQADLRDAGKKEPTVDQTL